MIGDLPRCFRRPALVQHVGAAAGRRGGARFELDARAARASPRRSRSTSDPRPGLPPLGRRRPRAAPPRRAASASFLAGPGGARDARGRHAALPRRPPALEYRATGAEPRAGPRAPGARGPERRASRASRRSRSPRCRPSAAAAIRAGSGAQSRADRLERDAPRLRADARAGRGRAGLARALEANPENAKAQRLMGDVLTSPELPHGRGAALLRARGGAAARGRTRASRAAVPVCSSGVGRGAERVLTLSDRGRLLGSSSHAGTFGDRH